MTTIVYPTLSRAPQSVEIGLKSNSQILVSPLSGDTQTLELPGARWTLTFSYTDLVRADAAELEAFLAQLRGQANRARVPVWGRVLPRGSWLGTPLVKGGSQTGASLACDGFTAGATVKRGDMLNIGTAGELKRVVTDATADGSGNLTLAFEPPLRVSPADNAALVAFAPVVPLMIPSDPHLKTTIGQGDRSDVALDLVELFA